MLWHPTHSFTNYLSPNVVVPNPLLHHSPITQCCGTQPTPSPHIYHPILWHPTHSFTTCLSPNVVAPNPLLHHLSITQCCGTQSTPSPLIYHPMLWHPTHSFTTYLSPNVVAPNPLFHHLSITHCCGTQPTPSPLIYHPILLHPTCSLHCWFTTQESLARFLNHPRIAFATLLPPKLNYCLHHCCSYIPFLPPHHLCYLRSITQLLFSSMLNHSIHSFHHCSIIQSLLLH